MSNLAFPLQWPMGCPRTRSFERQHGHFKNGTVTSCLDDLRREIGLLTLGQRAARYNLDDIMVVSSNLPLRRDGMPSGSAPEPVDPGVAVYFRRWNRPDAKGKHPEVCFPCDKYNRTWKNMRAIAHTLEAMRGIERWGSSQLLDRAFTGFAALPAPSSQSVWDLLELPAECDDEDVVMTAWRRLVKSAHPDVPGGSHDSFANLCQAKDTALATIQSRRAGR